MTNEGSSLPRRRVPFPLVALGFIILAVGLGWAIGNFRRSGPSKSEGPSAGKNVNRGAVVYQMACATCHGPEGHGDGPTSLTLRPPPRDFAVRPWRFEPTKESIRRIILEGIPGTAMPAGRSMLATADIEPLVDYVHALATARPPKYLERSVEEKYLHDAGFVDLRGTEPPVLSVVDAQGRQVKLADLKGRFVLIHFWGTTCAPCLHEMPHLKQLESEWSKRPFTILHVCVDAEDANEAQQVLDQSILGVRALVDENGLGLARFEVKVLPTVWLIDPMGKAIGRSHGAKDWKSPMIRKLIEHWLPAS